MKYIKDIVISISEPPVNNVEWLRPLSNGTFMLFFFGDSGWTPISVESVARKLNDILTALRTAGILNT